jgi:hypothetical protein
LVVTDDGDAAGVLLEDDILIDETDFVVIIGGMVEED